ncbi:hypothetical protein TTHERM_000355389 (macronuclear) [Tetrahymena thermophila SB210]|uniref:Uncharacterized protein n=1 Tax=Tetrahymena thermophila (strain SB210) TaxID=312017 RepID=W7XEU4_TETTS|nr:hypothetical protein TTHERM_000355389 [Tetrahymena thermophila SB210]EWS75283.1 hypothetical protein TTHERM_000355389 [Tetrahymena thermophila SB210]|eukprot:XP_012652274.1 hypothetical protein TTHERM_000355389 [Tetrahymena thermophila SB210]
MFKEHFLQFLPQEIASQFQNQRFNQDLTTQQVKHNHQQIELKKLRDQYFFILKFELK